MRRHGMPATLQDLQERLAGSEVCRTPSVPPRCVVRATAARSEVVSPEEEIAHLVERALCVRSDRLCLGWLGRLLLRRNMLMWLFPGARGCVRTYMSVLHSCTRPWSAWKGRSRTSFSSAMIPLHPQHAGRLQRSLRHRFARASPSLAQSSFWEPALRSAWLLWIDSLRKGFWEVQQLLPASAASSFAME